MKAVFEIDSADLDENELAELEAGSDILSCKEYKIDEVPDDILEMILTSSPEWVYEHRPDFIQRCCPKLIN